MNECTTFERRYWAPWYSPSFPFASNYERTFSRLARTSASVIEDATTAKTMHPPPSRALVDVRDEPGNHARRLFASLLTRHT